MRTTYRLLAIGCLVVSSSTAPICALDNPAARTERVLELTARFGRDAMEGRGTGSRCLREASRDIAALLEQAGLVPAGEDGSWFQPVPMIGSRPLPGSELTVTGPQGSWQPRLGAEYLLWSNGNGSFVPTDLPLVFVGWGIVAPEYDHNDYQRVDVAGRIAVFFAGEPPSTDPDWFAGVRPTIHSDPYIKFRVARARGARGSVMLPSPREGRFTDWRRWREMLQAEDVRLPYGPTDGLALVASEALAEKIFADEALSWTDLCSQESRAALSPINLATRIRFSGRFQERSFTDLNVIGTLPGRDPLLRDRHIVVAAHLDHLGTGPSVKGDSVYNGVIDNALGVAAALALAERFSAPSHRPSRSLLFLFLVGEEKGRLGSRWWCDHPTVPLAQVSAAINIDGLAILDTTDDFVGVGAEMSNLGEILGNTLTRRGLLLSRVPLELAVFDPISDSDQLSFIEAGVPSLLVMEGHHYRHLTREDGLRQFVRWGRERYHSPFDDLDQPMQPEAILQHLDILFDTIAATAETAIEPQWLTGVSYLERRLQTLAEEP